MSNFLNTPVINNLGLLLGVLAVGTVLLILTKKASISKALLFVLKGIAFSFLVGVFTLIPHATIKDFPVPAIPLIVGFFGWINGSKFFLFAGLLGAILRVVLIFGGLAAINSAYGVNL